jgi:hypothetical protein
MRAWWLSFALVACNNSVPSRPAPPANASSPAAAPSEAPGATATADADLAGQDDAISRKVKTLDPHLWTNGLSPDIDLPATASTAEVLAKMFPLMGFARGHVTTHRVLTERDVRVGFDPLPYRVSLVDTDLGQKIVFLRYEAESKGWWTRVYDAP